MAALIDMSNNRPNIAYVGQKPWHGLGKQLDPTTPLETWRIEAGLDFQYLGAPVRFQIDPDAEALTFPRRQVIYRSDTLAPMSVVSDSYKAVQPGEILEFFRDLIDGHGFQMETAGSLKDGAVVWALAKTGRDLALGNDLNRQYALLMTSCDSLMATRATLTNVRVVCWNTLSLALHKEAANLIVTRHNTTFDADQVKANLGLVDKTWDEFGDIAREMAKTKLKDLDVKEAVLAIFGDPEKELKDQRHKRAMNNVVALFNGNGRSANFPAADGTAWGLLNAVTEHIDHYVGERNLGARLTSAWMGPGEAIKRKAWQVCAKLAA
jgi:phage/plasmid-like protein (TIGR03299 family)